MVWQIEISEAAVKELAKMDRQHARRITRFLQERVAQLDDPRSIGEALRGSELGEFWKYRVGDWRIISKIEDGRMTVLVVRVGFLTVLGCNCLGDLS